MNKIIISTLFVLLSACGPKPGPTPPEPIDPCEKADAGPNMSIKKGDTIEIGKNHQQASVKYNWLPSSLVRSPSLAKTMVSPQTTTVYMLVVKSSCGVTTSLVKVKVL